MNKKELQVKNVKSLNKKLTLRIIFIFLLVIILTFIVIFFIKLKPTGYAIITVPTQYSTIQEAINAATPGDTIQINSGTYNECIDVTKTVTLEGESKENSQIICPTNSEDAMSIRANNVIIRNLNIRGTGAATYSIDFRDKTPTAKNVTIEGNILYSSWDIIGSMSDGGEIINNDIYVGWDGLVLTGLGGEICNGISSVSPITIKNNRFYFTDYSGRTTSARLIYLAAPQCNMTFNINNNYMEVATQIQPSPIYFVYGRAFNGNVSINLNNNIIRDIDITTTGISGNYQATGTGTLTMNIVNTAIDTDMDIENTDTTGRVTIYVDSTTVQKSQPFITSGTISYYTLDFVNPTPKNRAIQSKTNVEINTSIEKSNLKEIIFNWNSTDYSLYDSSLVLMLGLNNLASLDESSIKFVDVSNYSNNGTCSTNCPTFTPTGKYGGAYSFDGTNDYINVPSSASLNFDATKSYTWQAWIYPTSISSGFGHGIFYKGSSGTGYGIYLRGSGTGNICVSDNLGGATETCTSIATININKWTHIAITYSNKKWDVYINGNYYSLASLSSQANDVSQPLFIGRATDEMGSQNWFNGIIDEVKIWNRKLSQNEINQSYMSNLYKYEVDKWILYVNQTKNPSTGLSAGKYTYNVSIKDNSDYILSTETRNIMIGCGNLDIENAVYYLEENLTSIGTCINVTANNITLDCQNWNNKIIYGAQVSPLPFYGIWSDKNYTTIKNCEVRRGAGASSRYGIYFINNYNSKIENTNVSNNAYGITLYSSLNNNITKNTLVSNNMFGIYLSQSLNNIIKDNIASSTTRGIALVSNSNNNTIKDNIASSNSYYNLLLSLSSNNTIQNITTQDCSATYSCVRLTSDSQNNIFKNLYINTGSSYGIWLDGSSSTGTNNNIFQDIKIENIADYDVYLQQYAINNTFLNVTYQDENIGTNSELIRKWYYKAYVNNSLGFPLANVNISAYNYTDNLVENLTTDINGWTELGDLIEYVNSSGILSSSITIYYSNYTIYAQLSGYLTSSHPYNVTIKQNNYEDVFTLKTSEFTVDEFNEGNNINEWNRENGVGVRANVIDIDNTILNYLHVNHNSLTSSIYATSFTAPFIYKNKTGNFDFYIKVYNSAYLASGTGDYQALRFIARNPDTSIKNWYSVNYASEGASQMTTYTMNTVNGVSTDFPPSLIREIDEQSPSDGVACLRLKREGNEFTSYYNFTCNNANDDPTGWIEIQGSRITRNDLPDKINLGFGIARAAVTTNDFTVNIDYIREIIEITNIEIKDKGATLQNPMTVTPKPKTRAEVDINATIKDINNQCESALVYAHLCNLAQYSTCSPIDYSGDYKVQLTTLNTGIYCNYSYSGTANMPWFFDRAGTWKIYVNATITTPQIRWTAKSQDFEYAANPFVGYPYDESGNPLSSIYLGAQSGQDVISGQWNTNTIDIYKAYNYGNVDIDVQWNIANPLCIDPSDNYPCIDAVDFWDIAGDDFMIDDDTSLSDDTGNLPASYFPADSPATSIPFNPSGGIAVCTSDSCTNPDSNMYTYYHIKPPLTLPLGSYQTTITFTASEAT